MPSKPASRISLEQITTFHTFASDALKDVYDQTVIMNQHHLTSVSIKSATVLNRGLNDLISFSQRLKRAVIEEKMKALTGQPTQTEKNADHYRKYQKGKATAKKKAPK